jgi:hypothetical protein
VTGPEHYREAEELLGTLAGRGHEGEPDELSTMADAQVHATLALAAATALAAVVPISRGNYPSEARAWLDATGVVDEL